MGIASWIIGNHIDGIFEEIEDYAKESGLEINFDGAGELADFAVELKDTMDDKGQELSMRMGTSLTETFGKAVNYSLTAAGLDNTKIKLQEAIEAGNTELVEELTEDVSEIEEHLEGLEEDLLDDYRNLNENVDIQAMHVQRNYDSNGDLAGIDIAVNIENENNGDVVEMNTEINLNGGQLSKVNVGFDM